MAETKRPLKVFLCHTSADKPAVRKLYKRLVADGVNAWLDVENLLPGQKWEEEIPKAIRESDVVIVCLSEKSINKEGFVQKEIKSALDVADEKPEETIYIIPARLEECKVPDRLKMYQWVDLFQKSGYGKLKKSLNARAEKIGATLVDKIKKNALETTEKLVHEKEEKEIAEKVRLEAEELARRKAAKEKVDREAAEKVAREKAEKEAVEKARLEAEELARQKAAKEKADREAAEKIAREKAEKEAAEKERLEAEEIARQKAAKEKADRESAEKAAREKAEKDAAENALLEAEERARQEVAQKSVREEIVGVIVKKITHEKARLESDEQLRQKAAKEKAERESAEKIAREKAEKEAIENARLEAEEIARQKAVKEKIYRERIAREKMEREAAEKVVSEKIQRKKASRFFLGLVGTPFVIGIVIWISSLIGVPPTPISTQTPSNVSTSSFAVYNPHPDSSDYIDSYDVPMRLVPEGSFVMGSEDGEDDEKPVHQVHLDAFYMDKYEVTNILYKTCVDADACITPQGASNYGNAMFNNYPVVGVNWYQAKTYCEWRGGYLPTEAQWEKAARGTDGRTYPWGEYMSCEKANHIGCRDYLTEVGSFESGKSPYGIYDMAGNVWEWVADWYSKNYYQNSPSSNPQGSDSGTSRVKRGGAVDAYNYNLSSSNRESYVSESSLGFRCARDANP